MGKTAKFWMVLGSGEPVYRHRTKTSAQEEAERLAREHPGSEFVVLESLGTAMRKDVHWEKHENWSGNEVNVPF